jgi:ribose/xylose/arabinose/galactoside ABC-type transport system permease subunit
MSIGERKDSAPEGWSIRGVVDEFILVAALVVLVAVMSAFSPYFLTLSNILESTRSTTEVGLIALGMTLVVLTEGSTFRSAQRSR